MIDEIRERHVLSSEPDGDLSTADLAKVRRTTPRDAEADESVIEAEVIEVPAAAVPTSVNRTETVGAAAAAAPALERETGPLFSSGEAKDLRARWDAIQVGFVDEPRQAVEQADKLVAGTMKRLAEIFAEERSKLEGQWDQGENVSTEDLRLALRRYRSFFSRLLAI